MAYPRPLENLVDGFSKFPGIGGKSAERYALAALNMSEDYLEQFAEAIRTCKQKLTKCKICGHISEDEICEACSDESRTKDIICVLEDYKSVFAFEKIGNYKGVYHVLGGLISPMDDITPDDINIKTLVQRVKELEKPEIIIALKPSIEGETTTLYIKKILENYDVKISRLSYGIPMGAEIDYLDEITLDRALSDRRIID